MDIIKNDEFDVANVIFCAKTVELESMGLAKVEHKPSISKEDLRKVYNCGSFYTEDPKGYKTKYGLKLCCFSVDEGEKTYGNYRKIALLLGKILLAEDTMQDKG